ncbi:MAG: DMT family transporter [Myxococcales bacterium]|nr:DMT family transporter [Myxococcales bacterium]
MVGLAASSWGTWSLFLRGTKLPASSTSPIVLALIGLFALAFVRFEPARPVWSRTNLSLLAALAGLDALNFLTFFAAMEQTTLAIAVLTHYLAPLVIAIAAPFIERERVPGARGAAVLATGGLLLVLEPWHAAGGALIGGALGATSAVAYAGVVFLSRRLVPRIGAVRTLSFHAFVAAGLLLPFTGMRALVAIPVEALGLLALGALGPGALAGLIFLRGLDRVGASRAAVLTFLEPLVAVAVGIFVWRERLTLNALVGALIVLGAGLFVARRPSEAVLSSSGGSDSI